MDKLNRWYRKAKSNLLFVILVFILSPLANKWLSSFYENIDLDFLGKLLNYRITVSVASLIVGTLLAFIVFGSWRALKIRRSKLRILKAKYGANENWVDITAELNEKIANDELEVLINNNLAGDPIVGTKKVATIHYELSGKKNTTNINEGGVLKLPEKLVVTAAKNTRIIL